MLSKQSNLLIVIAVNPVVNITEEKVMVTMNTLPSFKGEVQLVYTSWLSKASNCRVDRCQCEESSGGEVEEIESDEPNV